MRFALCCAFWAATAAAGEAPKTIVITIVGTTDVHGHLEATPQEVALSGGKTAQVARGGAALLGGYLDNLRAARPGRVVLIDSGDMLQGTMVSNLGEGAAMMRAMNALGYDAAAVGNHEFDFGPVGPRAVPKDRGDDPRGALKARAGEARFPWLTANIVDAASGRPVGAPTVKAFAIVERAGVKVAIVGATSADTTRTTMKLNLEGLEVRPLAPSVVKAAAEARAAGATVVILAVHAGGECKRWDQPDDLSSCLPKSEVFELARALPAGTVDAIFAGHTHQGVAAFVAGVPVVQSFSYGAAFSRIDLTVDAATKKVIPGGVAIHPPTELCAEVTDEVASCEPSRARGTKLVAASYEGKPVAPDRAVAAVFAHDLELAASRRAEKIGVRLAAPLPRSHRAESPLGNLVADALRDAVPGADVGLTNGGGLRDDLPAGDVTYGQLFEVLPFDNRLAVMRLPGAMLRGLVTANVKGSKGILSLSGVKVVATCRGPRLEVAITVGEDCPLDDAATYTIATSDFLALGGDDFGAVAGKLASGAVTVDDASGPMRDLVAAYLRAHPGRPADPTLFDPVHPRIALPAPRPFSCK